MKQYNKYVWKESAKAFIQQSKKIANYDDKLYYFYIVVY